MNYLTVLTRLAAMLAAPEFRANPRRGDIGLYWAARTLAERLESRNPGIAQDAGFGEPIRPDGPSGVF
jgi:hypothetical protein